MAFELPKFSEIKETINQANIALQALDEKKLNTVKSIIADVVKLQAQGGSQGLTSFSQVMQMIATIPPEKLDKVAEIVSDVSDTAVNIQKMVKMLPPDALKQLPVADIVEGVKKAITGSK
jgi:uncharacterized protein Yka (UPF0111/DUF47 family)